MCVTIRAISRHINYMYYIFCERFYLFPEYYVIISFIQVFFYFAKVKISLFKENTYLIFAKLQQLKFFSSNLNAQSKKQVIFTSFLLPKKRFFFLVKSQCAILESSIFTIFMYVFLFFTEATDSFAGTIESHIT